MNPELALSPPGDSGAAGGSGTRILVADVAAEPRQFGDEGFEVFAARHLRELGRLGYLLSGSHETADDLAADTLLATWRQWERVRACQNPMAYVRRIMTNLAASRIRGIVRERRRLSLFHTEAIDLVTDSGPEAAVVSVDVRIALMRLAPRQRACVVLRLAFDLTEAEVAETLGGSVGTVKSQTFRAVARLQKLLGRTRDEMVRE